MKKTLNYLPFIVVLLAQFLINNYTIILIFTILIGFLAAFKIERKSVFLKNFIIGLIVFTAVFLLYESRVEYVKSLFVNLGLSSVFIYVMFPLFNALNTAILFAFGFKIGGLVADRKLVKNNQVLTS
jgi:CDP-diglyceride synthetase